MMTKKRMGKIVEKLKTVSPKEFDMHKWFQSNCNSVGCAIGHACTIPSFKRAGFKLSPYSIWNDINGSKIINFEIQYKTERGTFTDWDAITAFLDIDMNEAEYLFSATEYSKPTKASVIKRLKSFIKRGCANKEGSVPHG